MEEYYVAFKEKRSIYAEAQFEVDSLKNSFPDIHDQIRMRDWGPFTIPIDPYFSKLVWEFYASYWARKQLLKHKGHIDTLPCLPSVWVRGLENTTEVLIEVAILVACIMDHVHINVGELIADEFKRRAKTPPPPSTYSTTSTTQFHPAVVPAPTPLDFLKIAQRAQVHESQLMKLSKAIPSMIQTAIKKAMQPTKDKLKSLCSTIEVLQSEVISLRREVVALGEPPSTSNSNPPEPAAVPMQLDAPRSPPDD
ncbi:hypothetical protein HAX54_000236 [Datura stramonium]|uniref:Uncharacterized protein n=1 Tax=Datura stramonium TaxID=4076 RepID=A0ABS8WPP6_DATST|nr:hypothetical protein [Datura stramonium]